MAFIELLSPERAAEETTVLISPEEYLVGEKYSAVKHEYVAGHIYAMVGASTKHNRIAGNLYAALLAFLRGQPY
jgi:hypothetical protein